MDATELTGTTSLDEKYMRLALREAEKGAGYTSPNPLVGAVAVKGGSLLGKAYHTRFGDPHAEIALLHQLSLEQARGATIYVNLEPCCHMGKTPPCTEALIRAGVERVVVAHEDPNPLVSGKGVSQLRAAGIDVMVGVLDAEARDLNAPFLTYMTLGRPWILLKVAQSLDGRIALANGKSRWITGEPARTEVHRMRSRFDAVMVGSATVAEDDPELTVRMVKGRNPLRLVLDSHLRISPEAKVLRNLEMAPTWVLTTPDVPEEKLRRVEATGAKLVTCPAGADGKVDLTAAVKLLARRGITSLFVEGGGTLHASFIRAGLYDKFIVAIASKIIGADGKPAIWELGYKNMAELPQFVISRFRQIGADLWLELSRDVYRDS
ncbi:MAG TPA: bifunctional diaminohydroxyphosphoribosylaminopyrimidine deaminase/5-amino-6-(5-phosphoribosylamino)uracil reductase RibD [bacterium]|jgi:diaminohydroxyphosphoribosylaminopyrimidine deaminase/5-amino-6-(5-phosphoribosylamino)uracil reductase